MWSEPPREKTDRGSSVARDQRDCGDAALHEPPGDLIEGATFQRIPNRRFGPDSVPTSESIRPGKDSPDEGEHLRQTAFTASCEFDGFHRRQTCGKGGPQAQPTSPGAGVSQHCHDPVANDKVGYRRLLLGSLSRHAAESTVHMKVESCAAEPFLLEENSQANCL